MRNDFLIAGPSTDPAGIRDLTDRATNLVMAPGLDLVPLVEGHPQLANSYGVVRVQGRDAPAVHAFVDWITSEGAAP